MSLRCFFALLMTGALTLTACSSESTSTPAAPLTVPYKQVGYQEGAKPIFGHYFVVVNLQGIGNDTAYKDLKRIATTLCARKNVCFVRFWGDELKAATYLPMSDVAANSVLASYNINRNTGNNGFTCHPFSDPGQRCARL